MMIMMSTFLSVAEYKGIVYPGFVLYTVMIAVSLVMLPGVYMVIIMCVDGWMDGWIFIFHDDD
jgi:hypothetical protein